MRSSATAPKAWRFAGEMEEIADTLAAVGLPEGFHRAAADTYLRLSGFRGEKASVPADDVIAALLCGGRRAAAPETTATAAGCGSCRRRGKRQTVSRTALKNRQTGFPQVPQPLLLLTQGDRREKTCVHSTRPRWLTFQRWVAHFPSVANTLRLPGGFRFSVGRFESPLSRFLFRPSMSMGPEGALTWLQSEAPEHS